VIRKEGDISVLKEEDMARIDCMDGLLRSLVRGQDADLHFLGRLVERIVSRNPGIVPVML